MQRRIEQADGDRETRHDLEQLGEIGALDRQQLGKRCAPARFILGKDHFPDSDDPVTFEEHMLGAAKADPFRAEFPRDAGIPRRVGIGPHPHAAHCIRPFHEDREFARKLGLVHLDDALDAPAQWRRQWSASLLC